MLGEVLLLVDLGKILLLALFVLGGGIIITIIISFRGRHLFN